MLVHLLTPSTLSIVQADHCAYSQDAILLRLALYDDANQVLASNHDVRLARRTVHDKGGTLSIIADYLDTLVEFLGTLVFPESNHHTPGWLQEKNCYLVEYRVSVGQDHSAGEAEGLGPLSWIYHCHCLNVWNKPGENELRLIRARPGWP